MVSIWAFLTGFWVAGIYHKRGRLFYGFLRVTLIVLMIVIITTPFIKPILSPVEKYTEFHDRWRDEVCLQSGSSTCGPSSLATIFRAYDIHTTEENISRNCYTCGTGTENWYLIRYAEKNGFKVRLIYSRNLNEIPCPSILGVRLGNIGHFVTLLENRGEHLIIGDPLCGKETLKQQRFRTRYAFDGFVMFFSRDDRKYSVVNAGDNEGNAGNAGNAGDNEGNAGNAGDNEGNAGNAGDNEGNTPTCRAANAVTDILRR